MKALYFDCSAGAAGDMLLASLLDVYLQLNETETHLALDKHWQANLESLLGLEEQGEVKIEEIRRGGLRALKVDFFSAKTHADAFSGHSHRHASEIKALFAGSQSWAPETRELSTRVIDILAEAEAFVHGTSIEKVHFHEVGAFDSILDIAGFALAFALLAPCRVYASPATLGMGVIETAHGRLGVPPPAVVEIMKRHQIPASEVVLPGECLTPTGAALLAAVVDCWDAKMPAFKKVLAQGIGAGTREIETQPNVVRAIYGEV